MKSGSAFMMKDVKEVMLSSPEADLVLWTRASLSTCASYYLVLALLSAISITNN